MKWLLALNLVLTLCILVLVTTEDETHASASHREAAPLVAATGQNLVSPPTSVDEMQLRQIIREELAAQDRAGDERNTTSPQPAVTEADRQQREFVLQQIEYYKSVGHISTEEMRELQREIAKLDPAGRGEMASRLARALNAQQVDSQF